MTSSESYKALHEESFSEQPAEGRWERIVETIKETKRGAKRGEEKRRKKRKRRGV